MISKRYLLRMNDSVTNTDEIAELLVHIGRAARGVDAGSGLTAAQWTALRFFARANHATRTPSAFASFHATTRGTASQTVKSLLQKGYLVRYEAVDDRRSVRFDLSDSGHAIMCDDPLRGLCVAIDRLEPGLRTALRQALPVLAGALADIRETVAFGTCGDCRHFTEGGDTSYCACAAAELSPADLGRLCMNFASGDKRDDYMAKGSQKDIV